MKLSLPLTGLKKSPTHLAMMSVKMIGTPNAISPVHSRMITVRLRVILVAPPKLAAAPINAYLVIFTPYK